MAYDGYNSSANPYQPGNMNLNLNPDPSDPHEYSPAPPYPSSSYEPDRLSMPQPRMPPLSSSPQSMDSDTPRPQNVGPGQGYINDAVHSAVHHANPSEYLSPEVLSQITATVIQQLKATGLGNMQGSGSSGVPPPRSQSQQPSWSAGPDLAPRPHSESPPNISQRFDPMPQGNPMSNSFESTQPYSAPTVPLSSDYSSDTRDMRPTPKPSSNAPSSRRGSVSSHGSQKMERPKPPSRDATVVEMTTLEKIWGKLFVDGKPTKRLGQFLRGIAMHLIEDYPPGNTIVITPEKLQKFYADTDVSWDPYPWQDIFDDRTSSISRLFREVKAQHHLVQLDDLKERPDIPGLTPKGFETWATIMIQAHPEREYERLQKAVLNMPISNPDDKKERFPKEIPRRLFPEVADLKLREEVEEYIMKHCGVDLPRITEEERSQANRSKKPAPSHIDTSQPAPSTSGSTDGSRSYERGRPPPSASSSSAVIDDEDEPIPSKPIERERKPYTAQPGIGKKYEEAGHSRSRTESFSSGRPLDVPSSSTSHRHSTATADKINTDSLYSGRTGSRHGHPRRRYSRGSRSSSRGMSHDYRHSESDLLGRDAAPPRYGGVSTGDLYTDSPTSILPDEDVRRYRDHHRGGSRASEEDYYRGMLGGQGGGPVHEHKRYH